VKRTNVGAGREAAGFAFSTTILGVERDCNGTMTEVVSRVPKALMLGTRSAYMLGMNTMAVKSRGQFGDMLRREIFLPFEEDIGYTPEIGDFVFK
jgi:hypothetical protein